jgi:prepilin-type N-terminal cleavage/methylation domain-containing protein
MKISNKGFTLVELLAVVVILAIIMAIAAPNMTRQIQREEEENQNILNQKIENASKIYAAKYYVNELIELPNSTDDNTIAFTLNDLQRDGLINLKDNCSNNLTDADTIIIDSDGYHYDNIESNEDTCYELDN